MTSKLFTFRLIYTHRSSAHVDVAQMCSNILRCPMYIIIQTFLITFVIPARNAEAILSNSYQTGAHCMVFQVFGELE